MVDASNPDPGDRADAELDEIEERGVPSVTEKRGSGKNLVPLICLAIVALIGVGIMWQGLKPSGNAEQGLIPVEPVEQYSTGVVRQDRIPAFATSRRDEEPDVAAPAPPLVRQAAPPVDRTGARLAALRERQRLELERMQREQDIQLQGARQALELQRQRTAFESEEEIQRTLKQRREAPSLIFDDSKDEE